MREEEKQRYTEEYQERKRRGIPFFPDALFKDAVVGLIVFVVLVVLSAFVGAELGERANPADTSFTPRPEWYFLFLFQLLKYFPGNLEFLGVVVIPGVIVLLLLFLPWLDRSPKRNIRNRPVVFGFSGAVVLAVGVLSFLSVRENPPPAEAVTGDPVAALFVENCAGCHTGPITVPAGVDLTDVIAQGSHEGMPAWSGDLSTDEIDALAGFILSPNGSRVFQRACAECHEAADLAGVGPLTLRSALDTQSSFAGHAGLDVQIPTGDEASALLNFLIAPAGHRLYAQNCSSCHGNAVAFTGTEEELRRVIEQGGGHLTMPAMSAVLTAAEIDTLARYVVDPDPGDTTAAALFEENCSSCHASVIPSAPDVEAAAAAISQGGGHETMPVWGNVLTSEQLDALTAYAYDASQGSPAIVGQSLYAENCVPCHGEFGEGGPNPSNPLLVIPPISTAQYLTTRDDTTIRAIINQGQPDSGMSPFGLAYGGPLDEEEVGAIVAFIRSWQSDPPVEIPPDVTPSIPNRFGSAAETYAEFCSQCHGADGEGGIGPAFADDVWQEVNTDQQIFNSIEQGHDGTAMIAWGGILTDEQIQKIVEYLRDFAPGAPPGTTTTSTTSTVPSADGVSFSIDVAPLLQARCGACHGTFGGWSADDYDSVVNSGNDGPAVIPGDPDASLLVRLLRGEGGLMPPGGALPAEEIQLVVDWIGAGAPDN